MMLMSTMETVPGHHIVRHLGLVCGNTIRGKHVGKDIMAGLKTIVGGEIRGYTEMLSDARQEAVKRMEMQAEAMGANAVVNIRLSTAAVMAAAEVLAYGTAVVVEPTPPQPGSEP